ncbi:MAG: hypothetical protein EBX50_14925, partial [Chitinophagia bacterium]|nr:hypothetical protein [Chitinophagia bacterium]
ASRIEPVLSSVLAENKSNCFFYRDNRWAIKLKKAVSGFYLLPILKKYAKIGGLKSYKLILNPVLRHFRI